MPSRTEHQKPQEIRQETLQVQELSDLKVPEYGEVALREEAAQAVSQIEARQAETLSEADKRVESIPTSVGIDKQKADSILAAGGFAGRIRGIKDRISALAKNAKEKVRDLVPQAAESENSAALPPTLERYMERHPTGLEAVKEKARLAQLKLQGIKNPERVLAVAHYLEDAAKQKEVKHVSIDKTETARIEKEAEKLRKQGFGVDIHEDYAHEEKMQVWATKETAFSFNPRDSKNLASDLDEMAQATADPVRIFEALKSSGFKLEISKGWTLYSSDELKELFRNPNALAFLEKLGSFGGNSVGHDQFKEHNSLRRITDMASRDAAEHILTEEAEKGIEKVASLLGKPISASNLESWARMAKDESALELMSLLVQGSGGKAKDEREYLNKLGAIQQGGVTKEVIALLKDGFSERSLGKFYGWGSSNSERAVEDINAATEAFRKNPQLYQLTKGAVRIFDLDEAFHWESRDMLQRAAEAVPEAGPAFENLADLGVHENGWKIYQYLKNPENTAKYRKVLEAVAEPAFKEFTEACVKAGCRLTMEDIFNEYPDNNRLVGNYRDEAFRAAISSESGLELAKHLGLFEVPTKELNGWALRSLSQIPDALASLKKLEQAYGYKYNPNDDYGNYQLSSVAGLLRDKELCSVLFDQQTSEAIGKARAEFGLEFEVHNMKQMAEMGRDQDFQDKMRDPDTLSFVRLGLKEGKKDLTTVAALAKCHPSLRPVIEKLAGEFGFEARGTYAYGHKYDPKTGDYLQEKRLTLEKQDRLEQLRDNPELFAAQKRMEELGVKKDPLENIEALSEISRHNLFPIFEKCAGSPKIQEFLWRNLDTAASMAKLPPEKVSVYLEIFQKIDDSPSQEIQRLKDSLLSQLIESQHPVEDYAQIESIFIKNNIPTVGKVYGVFEILHSPKNLEYKISQKTSPILQQSGTRKRYYTIYQDLLKIHIESGNRSMKEYAEVLQEGGGLVERFEKEGPKSLSPRQRQQLGYVVGKLETLLAKSSLDTSGDAFRMTGAADLEQRVSNIKKGLKVAEGQTVLERVSEMYLKPAGLKNLEELLERMRHAKTAADERGRKMVAEARASAEGGVPALTIKAGDFLKGVDSRHIANILQNGSVAKEYLGASSDSDATPLDTDISLVKPEDAAAGFSGAIDNSLAKDYGEILFALRDRGQYQLTEAGKPAKSEAGKMELFKTGVLGERHYGIRTGFPTTEIDFMVAKESIVSRPKEMENLFFEIAQNGYYIPVADSRGKVIFTPEVYDEYRKSFAGLEKFGAPPLDFHPLNPESRSYAKVGEIAAAIPEDSERVGRATQTIRAEIEKSLGGLGVSLRAEFDTGILGAELMDTGSTGRHTNTPGDFDFDFSLKLDAKDFSRAAELAKAIKDTMTFAEDNSHQEAGGYYQLRVKGVASIGGRQLESPLDIDIGFASKSDLSVYGSHDAIRDKLGYIKKHAGQASYEQAVANVILTKQVLKEGHAYKKQEQGGMGGIGVENWILANGGNMEQAFRSFKEAAYENGQRLPLDKFREKYRILDAGTNVKFLGHDNFISILKPEGYKAMLDTIDAYLT